MKPDFKKFITTAKKVRMTDGERLLVRRALISEIETSAVREGTPDGHIWWSSVMENYSLYTRFMPIALLIAIFAGGGISYAAESALPGESLYPVKVTINETVRGWVSFSGEAKADWETRRVERRLEEAEELAADAKLTADTRTIIEANFDEFAARVEERVKKFESNNPEKAAEIASKFETSLQAHARILEEIGRVRGGDVKTEVDTLLLKIRIREDSAEEDKIKSETKIKGSTDVRFEAAATAHSRNARRAIDNAKAFLVRVKALMSAEAFAQAEARLDVAERIFREGKVKLDAGAFGDAFILFQEAKNTADKIHILMNAKVEFDEDEKDEDHSGKTDKSDVRASTSSKIDSRGSGSSGTHSSDDTDDEVKAEIETEIEIEIESESGDSSASGDVRGKINIDLGL